MWQPGRDPDYPVNLSLTGCKYVIHRQKNAILFEVEKDG